MGVDVVLMRVTSPKRRRLSPLTVMMTGMFSPGVRPERHAEAGAALIRRELELARRC